MKLIVLEDKFFSDQHVRMQPLFYAQSGLASFLPGAVHRLEGPVWISSPSIPHVEASSFPGLPL